MKPLLFSINGKKDNDKNRKKAFEAAARYLTKSRSKLNNL